MKYNVHDFQLSSGWQCKQSRQNMWNLHAEKYLSLIDFKPFDFYDSQPSLCLKDTSLIHVLDLRCNDKI